jgi:hypothetical protein
MNPTKTSPESEPNRPDFQEIERTELERVEGGIGPIIDTRYGAMKQMNDLMQF